MTIAVFTNFGSSLLASGILAVDTQFTVTSGEGALFPSPGAGQHAIIVLEDVSGNREVVKCTGRTGDTLTIVRAQESTTALAFASGSVAECRPTAGVATSFLQKTGGDTLTGTTTLNGTVSMGGSGSIRNGEFAGGKVRGTPGDTTNELAVPAGGGPPTIGASVILTAANLVSQLPVNAGLMLTGMVCFWSGASDAIPAGYVLCNGASGTPDLRDKFVLCGGGALPTSGGSVTSSSNGAHDHGAVSGSHTLTIPEMPAHTHTLSEHVFVDEADNGTPIQYLVDTGSSRNTGSTGGGGGHTHTISSDGAHTHTHTPPYVAMFAIMKT